MNLKEISPKVYIPVGIAILAGIALYLLTGDKTYLISILISLGAGGAGVAAKPAPGVTQKQVVALARQTPPAPPSS